MQITWVVTPRSIQHLHWNIPTIVSACIIMDTREIMWQQNLSSLVMNGSVVPPDGVHLCYDVSCGYWRGRGDQP